MPEPDLLPEKTLAALSAYRRTAALRAALELDLFTAIGAGAAAPAELAVRCAADQRGVRVLADYLVLLGLLGKHGDRYSLSAEAAAFLDRGSPQFLADAALNAYSSGIIRAAFERLTDAVRSGTTALGAGGTLAPEHPVWADHARAVAPFGRWLGPLLARQLEVAGAGPLKVLDIAAGHGLYGIAIALANPGAEIFAQDWPHVLAVARRHAEASGVGARLHTIPGDVFAVNLGAGYDLALITNFLPDFSPDDCVTLLARVRGALRPGGRAAALQWIPDDARLAPPGAVTLALAMLATTPAGDTYTYLELQNIFRAAGFARVERCDLSPSPQGLVVGYA